MTKFIIKKIDFSEEKLRLDKFLTKKLEISRSQIKKLILNQQVLINNKIAKVHEFLKHKDVVEIVEAKNQENKKTTNQQEEKDIKTRNTPTNHVVLHKNEDYLIIKKPSGLLVHPTETSIQETLVDQLLKKFPKLRNIGESPERPALIHRLDKDVSGIMVIPRTQDMFDHLKKQFKTRKIKKEYFALAYGAFEKSSGEINFRIIRSKDTGLMTALPKNDERGKEATTLFNIIKQFTHLTFLKLTLKTGRTHQLRVHLHTLNKSIVGDKLYKQKNIKQQVKVPRIFLHAHTLGFFDLKNNWQEFECALPENLDNILKTLK